MSNKAIQLNGKKALLWDYYYIDRKKTTAKKITHKPSKRERVITFDKPWEGDCITYYHIVRVGELYRMYYKSEYMMKPFPKAPGFNATICCIESADGINWTRPNISKFSKEYYAENNVIMTSGEFFADNFAVFYDENPACPKKEKFKAICAYEPKRGERYLMCFISEDGLSFEKGWPLFGPLNYKPVDNYVSDTLWFDSLNMPLWNEHTGKYMAFVRGFHDIPQNPNGYNDERDMNFGVRDIRVTESVDFRKWSNPRRLEYDTPDYAFYTNAVSKYPESYDTFIGFPTRYTEYPEWNDSFTELCTSKIRKDIVENYSRRSGLALTDAIFMFSRGGYSWTKIDEAFFTPGAEQEYQWTYGNCYPSAGLIRTYSEGTADGELSMYMSDFYRTGKDSELFRYSVRVDGFISFFGDFKGDRLVTKPLQFTGDRLSINFSTSAAGFVQFKITDSDGNSTVSQRHFGDKVDRIIKFDKDLAQFAGKPIVLDAELKDAHLFSFNFI